MDWHALFITLHAAAGAVCLASGLIVVWPRRVKAHAWLFQIFFWSLVALVVFVIAATGSHWTAIDNIAKLSFSGLVLLGFYMIYRGFSARAKLLNRNQFNGYIDDIGFILISLFVGLAIVPLIRLESPVWLTVLIITLIIFAGNRSLKMVHTQSQDS